MLTDLHMSTKTDVFTTSRLPALVILGTSSIFILLTLACPFATRTLWPRPKAIIWLNEVTYYELCFRFFLVVNKTKISYYDMDIFVTHRQSIFLCGARHNF